MSTSVPGDYDRNIDDKWHHFWFRITDSTDASSIVDLCRHCTYCVFITGNDSRTSLPTVTGLLSFVSALTWAEVHQRLAIHKYGIRLEIALAKFKEGCDIKHAIKKSHGLNPGIWFEYYNRL